MSSSSALGRSAPRRHCCSRAMASSASSWSPASSHNATPQRMYSRRDRWRSGARSASSATSAASAPRCTSFGASRTAPPSPGPNSGGCHWPTCPTRRWTPSKRSAQPAAHTSPRTCWNPYCGNIFATAIASTCVPAGSTASTPTAQTVSRSPAADTTTGSRRTIQARYVIAADGAASAVRRALGIAMEGPILQNMISVHFSADLEAFRRHRRGPVMWTHTAEGAWRHHRAPSAGRPGVPDPLLSAL